MASIIRFALAGIIGGVAIGALAALTLPLAPVAPMTANVVRAIGNPAAGSSLSANDQSPMNYGDAPLSPPVRADPGAQVAYMPAEGNDVAGQPPPDLSGVDGGGGNGDPAAPPADDAAGRAADAARDAADDARAAGASAAKRRAVTRAVTPENAQPPETQ